MRRGGAEDRMGAASAGRQRTGPARIALLSRLSAIRQGATVM